MAKFALNIGTNALIVGEIEGEDSALNVMLCAIDDPNGVTTIVERDHTLHVRNSAILLVSLH